MMRGYDETLSEYELARRIDALEKASADDLRRAGWMVAVHNDYRQNGKNFTFWLFTKDGRAVRGEGATDAEALEQVRAQVKPLYRSEDSR